jgi:hypothetical protein
MGRWMHEDGLALIVVLGFIAVMAVLAAHLTVSSEVIAREAKVASERGALRSAAESGVERAFWLHVVDRRDYRFRRLDVIDTAVMTDEERWLADGAAHSVVWDRPTTAVRVLDADRGIDLAGPRPDVALRKVLLEGDVSLDYQDAVGAFLDVLMDYVDRGDGDLTRLYGKERDAYEAEGVPRMPRNGPLEFREEILWIDGLTDVFEWDDREDSLDGLLETFRIVPPAGRGFSRNTKPSFFSASPSLITRLSGLTDDELAEVLEARQRWARDGGVLADYIGVDVWSRLQPHFSFVESGVVTVEARAVSADGSVVRVCRVTRDCRRFPGAVRQPLDNWERVWP